MTDHPNLAALAQEIDTHLRAIRAILRRPLEAEFARGNLTAPQRAVMQALYRSGGLSLKDLSHQLGLAHSTVSGIVDRLQQRGLVQRHPNQTDRRATVIAVAPVVRDYMRDTYPVIARDPITAALRHATSGERAAIIEGLRTLHRLILPAAPP